MDKGVYVFVYFNPFPSYITIRTVVINIGEILMSQIIISRHPHVARKRLSKRLVDLYFGTPEHNSILYHRINSQELILMRTTCCQIYRVK